MTLGTLTICILGLAYAVLSIYAIMDLLNSFEPKEISKLWCLSLAVIVPILLVFVVLPYLIANWDKPLW